MRKIVGCLAAVALAAGVHVAVAADGSPPSLFRNTPASLPAPYDRWHVQVAPDAGDHNLLVVSFDSLRAADDQRETRELVQLGLFQLPHTRVRILG